MNSATGDGIIILTVFVGLVLLVLAVLLIFAPLMLYRINSRLGETNDLLRYLAERSSQPQPQPQPTRTPEANHFSKTGEMVLPSRPDDSAPTFRTLR